MSDAAPPPPTVPKWQQIMNQCIMLFISVVATLQNTGAMAIALLVTIPTERRDFIMLVVNATGTLQGMVLQYYFGSSAGSASKEAALQRKP